MTHSGIFTAPCAGRLLLQPYGVLKQGIWRTALGPAGGTSETGPFWDRFAGGQQRGWWRQRHTCSVSVLESRITYSSCLAEKSAATCGAETSSVSYWGLKQHNIAANTPKHTQPHRHIDSDVFIMFNRINYD